MTPQARRAPALPVVLEVLPWVPISEESPLPRSSSSSWMTHARPMMELVPSRGICKQYTRQSNCPYGNEKKLTWTSSSSNTQPSAVATTLPRSPAWRFSSVGAPWSLPAGLKWGPVDMHPLVVSPNSWMWKPCLPAASPLRSPETLVGPSPDWVKVTTPSTPAVPVRTQTAFLSAASTTRARRADAGANARAVTTFLLTIEMGGGREMGQRDCSLKSDEKGSNDGSTAPGRRRRGRTWSRRAQPWRRGSWRR